MTILFAAAVTGLAALSLTSWISAVAETPSWWLGSRLHVALAALGGAGAAALARTVPELLAFTVLALACALLAVIDLASYRLPDIIVGPMYPILFGTLTIAAIVDDEWADLGRAVAATGVIGAGYLVLALFAPSGMGLGDVKFSGLLAAFLGWLGWPQAVVGTLAGFVLGALFGIALLVGTNANRRTAFPFGPWMVAGAAVGAAYGALILPGIHH